MMDSNEKESDILKEFVNIGMGKSAQALNQLFGSHIILHIPSICVIDDQHQHLQSQYLTQERYSYVKMDFQGDLYGCAYLLFAESDVMPLMTTLLADQADTPDFSHMQESVLKEIGNIVTNSLVGSICNMLQVRVAYTLPVFRNSSREILLSDTMARVPLKRIWADTFFTLENVNIKGYIFLLMETNRFDQFLEYLAD